MNGSYQINRGLKIARKLLLDITEIGLPAAGEFLGAYSNREDGWPELTSETLSRRSTWPT
jgi:3-deoxy-7-phosphoheptulonate synthase